MNAKSTVDIPSLIQIAEHPDLLEKMNVKNLRRLWTNHFSKKPAPPSPILLRHELAFVAQAKEHGSLNSETRMLIKQAIRFVQSQNGVTNNERHKESDNEPENGIKQEPITNLPTQQNQQLLPRLTKPKLTSGTLLVRKWQGTEHKVTCQNKQFIYQGQCYRSLTKIAEVITGTHWSGPRFFGLTTLSQ